MVRNLERKNAVQIYIQSRGFDRDDDYRWMEVSDRIQQRTDKQDLPDRLTEAIQLIDAETFSIVLARKQGQLLLLLTGLEPEGRLDVVDRQIRIAIAWIVEESEQNERVLRKLCDRALNEEQRKSLTTEISQAVKLGGEEGFYVDFPLLQQQFFPEKMTVSLGNQLPDTRPKIAQLSPVRQKELTEELQQYCLPTQEGTLVVVTGIKKEETLKTAGVWRALSSLVKTDEWQFYERDRANPALILELLGLSIVITAILGFFSKIFK